MSSRVRLAHSVWPSVWGWKAVDIARRVPMVRKRLCQNLLVNLASWSETMDVGRPWRWKTWSKKIFAVSGAVAVVRVGTRCTIFEKVSTKTTMASKPDLVRGSCVMKSMALILLEDCADGEAGRIGGDDEGKCGVRDAENRSAGECGS